MSSDLKPEFLADYESPSSLSISPTGQHVVYSLRPFWVRKNKEENVTASLWIADIGKKNSARQLTSGKHSDSSPKFSPDGKYISFVSDKDSPGEGGILYSMPTEGSGECVSLLDEKGIGEYKWSPDGKQIAFVSPGETNPEKKKKGEEKDDAKIWGEDWDYNRLRILDIASKTTKTVVEKSGFVASFAWNDDSTRMVIQEWKTPEFNSICDSVKISVVEVDTREISHLCDFEVGWYGPLHWTGKYVYWPGVALGRSQTGQSLFRVEADAKQPVVEKVGYGQENCACDVKLCGNDIVVYVQQGLVDRLYSPDGKILHEESVDISRGYDLISNQGKVTVAAIKAVDLAMPLEVFSIVEGQQCQLSNHSEEFARLKLARSWDLHCTATDGLALNGIISVPSTLSNKKGPHPAVVLLHGGPYSRVTRGSDPALNWETWLLSLGYVVIIPNYRGGSGRGSAFAEGLVGDIGSSYYDCIDLLKKAISDGVVDEKRVAAAGWSHGGFLSSLCAMRDSTFHFAAAIPGAGMTDWDTMILTCSQPTYYSCLVGNAPWMSDSANTHGRKSSPIWHMEDIKTPILILHGEKDERVPVEQAASFHRGLMARGKECEMVIYPREGHCWPVPFERQHYIHMLKKIETFLAKHLA